MVRLWGCEICGDPYIGESPPANCPFCGAHRRYIGGAVDAFANFDVELNGRDRKNAERALKVEEEHASVWKKILKPDSIPKREESCSVKNRENLEESHARENRAIEFYKKAASEAENPRVREIFEAFVEVETDHLKLSGERIE